MTHLSDIEYFLGLRRLAVIGVSRNRKDFTRTLFREFRQRGYDVVPVNPGVDEVEGLRCYPRVQDISPAVQGALLLTSPGISDIVVRECAEAGITSIWMYRAAGAGAVSADAVRFCEGQGIRVIAGECPFMFLPHAAFLPHRLHGLIRKVTGAYPR